MTRVEKIAAGVAIVVALAAGLGPAVAANVSVPDLDVELASDDGDAHDGHDDDHGEHAHDHLGHDHDDEVAPPRRGPTPGLPPTYLRGHTLTSLAGGPAGLLYDGTWAGHREPVWHVFDLHHSGERAFQVRVPAEGDLDAEERRPVVPYVQLESARGAFAAYDARRHPSSEWSIGDRAEQEPTLAEPTRCERCDHDRFRVAVGFEIPSDSEGPDDVSWFALAVRCARCAWQSLIYGDETS